MRTLIGADIVVKFSVSATCKLLCLSNRRFGVEGVAGALDLREAGVEGCESGLFASMNTAKTSLSS